MKNFSLRSVAKYNLLLLYFQASCQAGEVYFLIAQHAVLYMNISIQKIAGER